uniref:XIAP associated factor 1 n=1 Tax=Nothobranchius rachovii TaxID=451742 RepID=A0A1A8S3P2_9TELE
MEGESTESGTTSIQAETLDGNQEDDDPQSPQKPEEENRDDSGACDEEAGEDLCVGAETSQQEEVMTTHTQDGENGLPRSNLSTEEKTADASVPPTPSITKSRAHTRSSFVLVTMLDIISMQSFEFTFGHFWTVSDFLMRQKVTDSENCR